ncbi:MAG: hypothetical protein B9S34_11435 [Opitutia bacterium Tous-C1TDCM]|nr:MAG: hypothetical protein B9S34_11435 [Opitutae bacterium Tous-C1TDCM]
MRKPWQTTRQLTPPAAAASLGRMFTIIGGDGKEYGPVTADQIRAWIAGGRANLDTKAKAVGTEEWRRLGDFSEFAPGGGVPPVTTSVPPFAAPGAPLPGAFAATPATPELADRISRLGAALLDGLLASVAVIPGLLLMGPAFVALITAAARGEQPDFNEIGGASVVLGALAAGAGWFVQFVIQVWMISTRGQSIGKRLLGIRIVKFADHSNPGFLHGWFLRNFVRGVIQMVPYIGFFFALVDLAFIFGEQRRCLHDLIAGTKVVKA